MLFNTFIKIKIKLYNYRKHFIAVASFFFLLAVFKLFSFSVNDSFEDGAYQDYFNSSYKIFGLNIPKDLNFSNEKVPINDFNVRENIDRELLINTYWQSQTLLIHKRCNRWFPVIEPILKKYGIPDDFKYLAIVESGLNNIVSPSKATGYWQIMENTAKFYGLEINDEIDERYNIEKSTEAACKYFKDAYQKFNNWTLVAASYNMGMGGLESQLLKQRVNSFYDLLLNDETSRYIFRILAIKEIISKPKVYGYLLRKKDLYPAFSTFRLTIDSSINNLADFAINHGINYKILKILNPWLRRNQLTNKSKKNYSFQIPEKKFLHYNFDEFGSDTSQIISNQEQNFYVKANEIIPDSTPKQIIHIVKSGETILSLAKKYNVDDRLIRVWNMLPEKEKLSENSEVIIFLNKTK